MAILLKKITRDLNEGDAEFKCRVSKEYNVVCDHEAHDDSLPFSNEIDQSLWIGRFTEIRPNVMDTRSSMLWGLIFTVVPANDCCIVLYRYGENRGIEMKVTSAIPRRAGKSPNISVL